MQTVLAICFFLFALTIWVGSLVLAYRIGKSKGQLGPAMLLTFLIGPLGLILVIGLPKAEGFPEGASGVVREKKDVENG